MSFKLTRIEVELIWDVNDFGEEEETTEWHEICLVPPDYKLTLRSFLENTQQDWGADILGNRNLIYTNVKNKKERWVVMVDVNDELRYIVHIDPKDGEQRYKVSGEVNPYAKIKELLSKESTDFLSLV